MAAGIQPTVSSVNQQAGQFTINLRNAFQQIIYFSDWLNAVGSSGLVAIGFTAQDAATIISTYGNLAALANIYQGLPENGPALPFNFEANSNALWGGQ